MHALNPYGFSHQSRSNEDCVDLNRNFVDFTHIQPSNPDHDNFRNKVFPQDWRGSALPEIYANVDSYINSHGLMKFQKYMTQGQYHYDSDPYYGGQKATWSHKTWGRICRESLSVSDRVVHIDIHTGLGPAGTAELIYAAPYNKAVFETIALWHGKDSIRIPTDGDSLTNPVSGVVACGLVDIIPEAFSVALEYGTVPLKEMLKSLIADSWLRRNQDCCPDMKADIVSRVRSAFCIEHDPDWIDSVWSIMQQRFQETITGLSSE